MAIGNTVIGGNFTGRAVYDTGVFPSNIAEDVSDLVSMISPYETPFLTILGDAEQPARSILHEWLEDELNPNTITVTATLALPAATAFGVANNEQRSLQIGAILRYVDTSGVEEYLQLESMSGNTITVARAFAGTTAVTIPAGAAVQVVNDVAVEGADVLDDSSRARKRKANNTMIFKKDVIVSGTMQAVTLLGGISDELDYQIQMRTREVIRDLEKAVILSRAANTIGGATSTRTMKGVLQQITTNSVSIPTGFDETHITAVMKKAWDNGGSDLDLVVCGQLVKEQLDTLNGSKLTIANDESMVRRRVETFEGTYGQLQVVMSRWMPSRMGVIISKNRIKVTPLSGRSFNYQSVARTGDSEKGMVIGEYTTEVRNEEGMVKFNAGNIGS